MTEEMEFLMKLFLEAIKASFERFGILPTILYVVGLGLTILILAWVANEVNKPKLLSDEEYNRLLRERLEREKKEEEKATK